jgi:tRNA threonylcarbamoyladenosine biosynthesis protein TsaE
MTVIAQVATGSGEDTMALAARLASAARRGDVIALSGDLGAGKTTFARGFIRALAQAEIDVPSPTFTLAQTYDTPAAQIWHFDLYRLTRPEDAVELGLEEALSRGVSLIEWPERLGGLLPRDCLTVTLRHDGPGRVVELAGAPAWRDRLSPIVDRLKTP